MSDSPETDPATGKPEKSSDAFRTISEVAADLDLPQHVLRFWESKFPLLRPLKRGGGRRYYRPEDVQLVTRIRDLLYNDGYTIKGVQKLLRQSGSVRHFISAAIPSTSSAPDAENGAPSAPPPSQNAAPTGAPANAGAWRAEIAAIAAELRALRDELHAAG